MRVTLQYRPRQIGAGRINVFRGVLDYQQGRGLGGVLRTVGKALAPFARKALPAAVKATKKLLKTAIQNRERGQAWSAGFREGLAPAALKALKSASPTTYDDPESDTEPQTGKGRQRKTKKKSQKQTGRGLYKLKKLLKTDVNGKQNFFNF